MHCPFIRITIALVLVLLVLASATALAPPLPSAPSRCSQAWRQSIVNSINQLETRVAALETPPSPPPHPPQSPPPSPAPPSQPPATAPAPPPVPAPQTSKITWVGADGVTARELIVEAPVEPFATSLASTPGGRGLDLSNRCDVKLADLSMGTLPADCDAIHVGNSQSSLRVSIDRVSADASNYGIYLGGVYHWRLSDVSISQQAGSGEHALRMVGDHVLFQRATIDSTKAGKRTVWCYGDDIAFIDCTLRGGAVWFGATPDAFPGSESITAKRILVRGGLIDHTRMDMPSAIAILPGSDDVVFEDVKITGPDGTRAADVDSRRMGAVLFRRCTWNGRPLKKDDLGDDSGRARVEP